MNTYELDVRAVCPVVDGERDLYHVTVRSQHLIEVEKILVFFATYAERKVFQEELTLRASTHLGAEVQTVGIHSGVKVTCVCP